MTKMKMRRFIVYACSLGVTGEKHKDLWSQDYVQHVVLFIGCIKVIKVIMYEVCSFQ